MKRLLLILLCGYAWTSPAEEQVVGRLFFTPQERATLDRSRQNSRAEITPTPEDAAGSAQSSLNLNGFVRRADGKGTVWINKQPIQESSRAQALGVGKLLSNQDKVTIELPGNRKISLDPGQHYEDGQIITPISVTRGSKP